MRNTKPPKMTTLIDDIEDHSNTNVMELSQEIDIRSAPKVEANHVKKMDKEMDKNKGDSFDAINLERVKHRRRGVVETPKEEPTDKNEAFLQSRKNKADFRKRRTETHDSDNLEPGEISYNTLGIFLRCN